MQEKRMKYSQILIGGALLVLLLFLAACSSQPTQTPIVNDTPKDLGTDQEPVIVTPPAQEVTVNVTPELGFDDPSIPKVSVTSLEVRGSRFDAKYIFNQIYINFSSDLPLDWDLLTFNIGNKFYNGTMSYNDNLSCAKLTDIIKFRNKKFGVEGSSTSGTICVAPARDMSTSEVLSLVGTYDGNILIEETIKIPSEVTTPKLYLK